jgi:hypothetical protein
MRFGFFRFGFPVDIEMRQKITPGRAVLGNRLIPMRAVIATAEALRKNFGLFFAFPMALTRA